MSQQFKFKAGFTLLDFFGHEYFMDKPDWVTNVSTINLQSDAYDTFIDALEALIEFVNNLMEQTDRELHVMSAASLFYQKILEEVVPGVLTPIDVLEEHNLPTELPAGEFFRFWILDIHEYNPEDPMAVGQMSVFGAKRETPVTLN